MGARVVNRTSYPTKTVERLVHRALADRDVDLPAVTVLVEHGRGLGVYGDWIFLGGAFGRARIRLYLPKKGLPISPYNPYDRKRSPGRRFPLADWKEALVALAAHEGEHHRQRWILGEKAGWRKRRGYGGQGSGTRRVDVENRCDLAAYRAWVDYRRSRKLPIPGEA